MPTSALSSPSIKVLMHNTASEFLEVARASLFKRESAANTILPYALEMFERERTPQGTAADTSVYPSSYHVYPQSESRFSQRKAAPTDSYSGHFWLTCWSTHEGKKAVLDLALSCTDSALGPHPIFLYSSLPSTETGTNFLDQRVAMVVDYLLTVIPATRVFSIFGPHLLVKNFARQWTDITGVHQEDEPIYAASLLYATKHTLAASIPFPSGDSMRRATLDDLLTVGQLCKEFADSSVDYPLTHERSNQEAMELILNRQVWVYETRDGHIASIVAVTRTSPNVAAITKVYTSVTWRRRGYAERLVRKVTQELLYIDGKQRVVLYVGHGYPAAKVYDRVGFVGLGHKYRGDIAEEWLETGFQGMPRGYW